MSTSGDLRYLSLEIDPLKETVVSLFFCRNYFQYTLQAIQSYYMDLPSSYNHVLILFDDGSTDDTEAYFSANLAMFKNFGYARFETSEGLTANWNSGVSFCLDELQAKYIFLLNNDIILPRGCLSRLISQLAADNQIGIIGPLTNAPGHQPKQDIRRFVEKYVPEDSMSSVQNVFELLQNSEPEYVSYLNGFAMGFKSQVFRANPFGTVEGMTFYFDPSRINLGNEDEFQSRLRGFRPAISTNSFVFHYKAITLERPGRSRFHSYRRVVL